MHNNILSHIATFSSMYSNYLLKTIILHTQRKKKVYKIISNITKTGQHRTKGSFITRNVRKLSQRHSKTIIKQKQAETEKQPKCAVKSKREPDHTFISEYREYIYQYPTYTSNPQCIYMYHYNE